MGMAVENKEISFDTMQQDLQIGADDIEAFVTDVVRTKMVYYKSDQTQRKVVVSHSTHRTFGKQQCQQLYDTMPGNKTWTKWKTAFWVFLTPEFLLCIILFFLENLNHSKT